MSVKMYDTVSGGGDGPMDTDQIRSLLSAAADWNARSEKFWFDRITAEQTRFCLWDGQSSDGRMHTENLGGKEPAPFDGCSDQRITWADELIVEQVALLLVAMMRAQPRCEGRGKGDGQRAQKATALLRWMIDKMGLQWLRQWMVLLNYALQDTPAVALMSVEWVNKTTLRYETLDAEQLAQMYMTRAMGMGDGGRETGDIPQGRGGAEGIGEEEIRQAMADFAGALVDPERGDDELAEMVLEFFPELKPARAKRIVRDIRKTGKADFPVEVLAYEGPKITARRFGDEFIIPDNSKDFEETTPWFMTEWLTEADLRARAAKEEWDEDFLADVLEQEGMPVLKLWAEESGYLAELGPDKFKGRYQVLWCYYLALNEDDVPARYVSVLHTGSEGSAFGRRMLRDAHGNWPGVLFQKEVLDGFLLNSRGIPGMTSGMQGMTKGLIDSSADAAQMWSLPPILSFGTEAHGNVYVEPLKIIKGKRDSKFEAMQPPQHPPQTQMVLEKLEEQRDWQNGRPNRNDVDGARVAVAREAKVVWFLQHVREVMRMMVALARENASDELLARVTDTAGDVALRDADNIAGEFDVRLVFDPADLDFKTLKERLGVVKDMILAIDRGGTVDTTPLAQAAFRSVFPYMADDVLRDVKTAEADELKDEAENLKTIRAGVMPQMDTDGNWNYELRRQWYDQMAQANQQIFADMGPDKQAILTKWLEGLEQQATQYGENVEIGRTGIVPPGEDEG